ncbi:hypothetical protein Q4485_01690 [Granulosicoccaceae sp. 1_MG-2023]|nr:hypothetical protein [Granulosicoccaceae sp. 1_MG-2023]
MSTDVFLRIGISSCQLGIIIDGGDTRMQDLRIGTGLLAARCFRQAPPTALEIKQAIKIMDETLQPLLPFHSGNATLYNRDQLTLSIAKLAGSDGEHLSREALEQLFEQFSAIAHDRAAGTARLPRAGAFSAQLIMLRQILRQLDFGGISLQRRV